MFKKIFFLLLEILSYFIVSIFLFLLIYYIYNDFISYLNKIGPNIYFENTSLSKMTLDEAKKIILAQENDILNKNIFLFSGFSVVNLKNRDIIYYTNKNYILNELQNLIYKNDFKSFLDYLLFSFYKKDFKLSVIYNHNKIFEIADKLSFNKDKDIDIFSFYDFLNDGRQIVFKDKILYTKTGSILYNIKNLYVIVQDGFLQKRSFLNLLNADIYDNDKKINNDKLMSYIKEKTKWMIREKIDGSINLVDNKVKFSGKIMNGLKIDYNLLFNLVYNSFYSTSSYIIAPTYEELANVEIDESLKKRGIKTLIATGISDFSGSPFNRRHNIAVGVSRYNGLIIAKNEIFSFNKFLGPVDALHGFLPELVIKSNKNEKEYGGGLCQVSTTAFRMALLAGFDIISRKNHRYMVGYYYPPGTDATIYPPSLDFKFKNNTDNDILIQSFIEGNQVYFNVFGTKKNIVVKMKGPYVYDYKPAPPTQYIETNTIPKGTRMQLDEAHAGMKSNWYRIIYENGKKIKEELFHSNYVPWAAKIYVGI